MDFSRETFYKSNHEFDRIYSVKLTRINTMQVQFESVLIYVQKYFSGMRTHTRTLGNSECRKLPFFISMKSFS